MIILVQVSDEVLKNLSAEDKKAVEKALKSLILEEGLEEPNIKILPVSLVPIRLQHIFRELGKEGYIVKGSIVLNGKLFLFAVKKGEKLDIAPDFEARF